MAEQAITSFILHKLRERHRLLVNVVPAFFNIFVLNRATQNSNNLSCITISYRQSNILSSQFHLILSKLFNSSNCYHIRTVNPKKSFVRQ